MKNDFWNDINKVLPKHSPSDKVWNRIEDRLFELDLKEIKLKEYCPSKRVWEKIDRILPTSDNSRKKDGLYFSLYSRKNYKLIGKWAIAACISAMLLIYSIYNKETSIRTTFYYSKSEFTPPQLIDWKNSDKELEDGLTQLCKKSIQICSSKEFKKLKEELEFLSETKQTLLNQMNPYEDNSTLEIELAKIEVETSITIEEIITLLINKG